MSEEVKCTLRLALQVSQGEGEVSCCGVETNMTLIITADLQICLLMETTDLLIAHMVVCRMKKSFTALLLKCK